MKKSDTNIFTAIGAVLLIVSTSLLVGNWIADKIYAPQKTVDLPETVVVGAPQKVPDEEPDVPTTFTEIDLESLQSMKEQSAILRMRFEARAYSKKCDLDSYDELTSLGELALKLGHISDQIGHHQVENADRAEMVLLYEDISKNITQAGLAAKAWLKDCGEQVNEVTED